MSGCDRGRHASRLGDCLTITMQLRGSTAARLQAEAKRRRRDPGELASEVLVNVVSDDLFSAVLDE